MLESYVEFSGKELFLSLSSGAMGGLLLFLCQLIYDKVKRRNEIRRICFRYLDRALNVLVLKAYFLEFKVWLDDVHPQVAPLLSVYREYKKVTLEEFIAGFMYSIIQQNKEEGNLSDLQYRLEAVFCKEQEVKSKEDIVRLPVQLQECISNAEDTHVFFSTKWKEITESLAGKRPESFDVKMLLDGVKCFFATIESAEQLVAGISKFGFISSRQVVRMREAKLEDCRKYMGIPSELLEKEKNATDSLQNVSIEDMSDFMTLLKGTNDKQDVA